MFERYTERARRIIFFARYEASQFGSPLIETEHLLLALLREDRGLMRRFLQHETPESIRREIEQNTAVREKVSTSSDLPLSDESKRVLANAADEAEQLSHKHIGTEHVFLGLLREEKCLAASLLTKRGVTLDAARLVVKGVSQDTGRIDPRPESSELSSLGTNLTRTADDLPALVGRAPELQRLTNILCRRTRKNPVLVGEPGVGRRTIVSALARQIAECEAPACLSENSILALDIPPFPIGEKALAWFERLQNDLLESTGHGIILFVEELHTPPHAAARGLARVQEILKRPVATGTVQCISTATPVAYAKCVEDHGWLEQSFLPIRVAPASESEAVHVLTGLRAIYQDFHSVTYTDESVTSAVHYANCFLRDGHLPGKAVDLMDEAGACVKARQSAPPLEIAEVQKRLKFIRHRTKSAIASHEFEKARFYSDEEHIEREKLHVLREKYKIDETASQVTREEIENVVARWTGISVEKIRASRPAEPPPTKGTGS